MTNLLSKFVLVMVFYAQDHLSETLKRSDNDDDGYEHN
jgi:hypothetical protein